MQVCCSCMWRRTALQVLDHNTAEVMRTSVCSFCSGHQHSISQNEAHKPGREAHQDTTNSVPHNESGCVIPVISNRYGREAFKVEVFENLDVGIPSSQCCNELSWCLDVCDSVSLRLSGCIFLQQFSTQHQGTLQVTRMSNCIMGTEKKTSAWLSLTRKGMGHSAPVSGLGEAA